MVIVIIIACIGTVARGIDTERFVKFDGMLDTLLILYGVMIPGFLKVIMYAKQCLRKIQVGRSNTIIQLKCPVKQKNAAGESISLALGGNIPDEKRSSICTVRCADQLFGGKENLEKFFIFNLRVECRIDGKTNRCAVASVNEGKALGAVFEVLCKFAHAIGATMNYISMAGTSSGIESKLGDPFLKGKHHPDGTPYFVNYLPSGYHLSLLAYHCPFMGTIKEQVRSSRLSNRFICTVLISSATSRIVSFTGAQDYQNDLEDFECTGRSSSVHQRHCEQVPAFRRRLGSNVG